MIVIRLKAVIAGFILGTLVGAAGLSLVLGSHLDSAELEVRRLRSEIEDLTGELENAEEKLAAREKATTVTEINVYVNFDNEYEKIELESTVKKMLKDLKGKEVSSLDPLIVANIIEGRTVETEEGRYTLSVTAALVSEKITIYLKAKAVKEQAL
ncbi:MAG: hypothetical protein CVU89_16480 [Firmicutes bacterium HGW-Firmicutes-14]|nr:MAG: hypothetical protein CVU89_16480 [Firmicutes bacterium HGW-Firmicutes-14]